MKAEKKVLSSRITYFILFCVFTGIEVLIALFVHDQFIRPYIGDVLVVFVVYAAVRTVFPTQFKWLPFYVFLFAALVEVLQYFDLVGLLGLKENVFFRIVLGSVFDWKDIACYGVGCLFLGVWQKYAHMHFNKTALRL